MALIINPPGTHPEEGRGAAPKGLPMPAPARASLPTKAPLPMTALPSKPMGGGLPSAPMSRPTGLPSAPPTGLPAAPQAGLPSALPTGLPAPMPAPAPAPAPAPMAPPAPAPTAPAPPAPAPMAPPAYVASTPAATPPPYVAPVVQQQSPPPAPVSQGYTQPSIDGRDSRRLASSSNGVKKKRSARSSMILMRWIVLGSLAVLVGLGVKSVIIPPATPTSGEIVAQVQQGIGITNFPASSAEGFVLGFANEYLTVDPEVSSSERDKALSQYTDTAVLTTAGVTYPGGYEQSVLKGPYVFGLRYTDNNTAVYTVGAETDTQGWVYISVNVFYDPVARAFSIPAAPSVASPPALSVIPSQKIAPEDKEASSSAKNTVDAFFKAWGASNQADLSVVLSTTADARAVNGLMGSVEFQSVSTLAVAQAENSTDTVRQATATVVWKTTGSKEKVTYTSTYQVLLIRASDNKWYVQDVLPEQFVANPPSS